MDYQFGQMMDYEEKTIAASHMGKPPILAGYWCDEMHTVRLEGHQGLGRPVGSGVFPAIPIPLKIVSRNHGEFFTTIEGCMYRDTKSTNGTWLNNRILPPNEPVRLKHGDILRVRSKNQPEQEVLLVYLTEYVEGTQWNVQLLDDSIQEIQIGRRQGELYQSGPELSKKHASFFKAKRGWALIDHDSTNGVYLNGVRLNKPKYLLPMDVVQMGGYTFLYTGCKLFYQADVQNEINENMGGYPNPSGFDVGGYPNPGGYDNGGYPNPGGYDNGGYPNPGGYDNGGYPNPGGYDNGGYPNPGGYDNGGYPNPGGYDNSRLVNLQGGGPQPVVNNRPRPSRNHGGNPGDRLSISIIERSVWNRMRKQTLLKDIHMEIPSGSMVLILGGSGAGKTTFMNAVMGYEPAKGNILYKGTDIYDEYEKMKYEIGYVPQQDLLRMGDRVWDTLYNAAQMRLPTDMPKHELEDHVRKTLSLLGLERERDSFVSKLSGGQRKRLSIAVEYVGNPSLFFLDEPDSGLDGTMSRALMENLRQIADMGKIILLISHSPDRAFELFDRIIVLAKGDDNCGHLVFFGSPEEACSFFGVNSLEKIVTRINRPDEGGEGRAEEFIRKFAAMGGGR